MVLSKPQTRNEALTVRPLRPQPWPDTRFAHVGHKGWFGEISKMTSGVQSLAYAIEFLSQGGVFIPKDVRRGGADNG